MKTIVKSNHQTSPWRFVMALLVLIGLFAVQARSGPPILNFTEKPIAEVGWSVQFQGSSYDAEADVTTYRYRLTAAGWEKDLSHWVLEICSEQVPTGSGILTKTGLDPTTGVSGFKWDDGQTKGTVMSYDITMSGHYGEHPVQYSVKGGTYFAIGTTTGPTCQPVVVEEQRHNISGIAFIDTDGDGVCDPGEPRLPNVSVNLADGDGEFLSTVMTDGTGAYNFLSLEDGAYLVGVQPETPDISGDFNETLTAYFTATTPTVLGVVLDGADSTDNNFGFRPDVTKLLGDLASGTVFAGTGKTIGFWKHQNTVALTGRGRAQVDAATLRAYLAAVQALFLPDPFRFTAGSEYRDALAILGARTSVPVELLLKQLLALELNDVAGWGLTAGPAGVAVGPLQDILIAWAESLVAGGCRDAGLLLQAKDICDIINNSGE